MIFLKPIEYTVYVLHVMIWDEIESTSNMIIGKSTTLKSICKKDVANINLCHYDWDYLDYMLLNQQWS